MAGSAIVSGNGVVLIEIPAGGATGEVLTKLSNEDFDFDWQPGGGGGGGSLQDAYDFAPAVPQITVQAGSPLTIDLPAATNNLFQLRDESNNVLVRAGTTDDALIELSTTAQGFRIMQMTTAQKNALTNLAGLLVYDTDLGQLQQNDGAGWSTPGAGLTTLQNAYDNSLGANPMITLDGVPTPISIQSSVAGAALEIRDVGAANTIFEVDVDPDLIVARTGFSVIDAFTNGSAANSITITDNFTTVAPYIGGPILSNGTVEYTNGVFIWALLQESKIYQCGAAPGFAAFTLFNALANIENSGNFDLVQALILNNGVVHRRVTAGASSTIQTAGLNNAPQTRTNVAGATMTKTTGDTAVRHFPTYSTVAGSTINMGTQRGLWCGNPAVALFGSALGVENLTAYIAVEVDAIPFGGNVTKRALRSALTNASNTLMIENTGGADSDFGSGDIHLNDNTLILFGATITTADASLQWVSATNTFNLGFLANTGQIRYSNPVSGQLLISAGDGSDEFTFDCERFSLGAQSGVNGNQVGNFVTPARTLTVAGDWADFLLTQAGSLTVNGLAMGRVSAWVINPVSYANSTGSVTNADTLTVGGFPTSSPGVTITNRQSLHVIGGRSRMASAMSYDQESPSALSAGNNNDYGGLLTGTANNGMRHWARLSADAAGSTITGIDATAAQEGDCFKLTNVSGNTLTLAHQDANSSAANRIISPTGANYVLSADQSAEIIYDGVTSRWRILYGSGA